LTIVRKSYRYLFFILAHITHWHFRVPRWFIPVVCRVRHFVLVCARKLFELHPTQLGVRRVDDPPHTGSSVHTGITIFPHPGRQKSWRRGGVGPASGRRSRLQDWTRRDTSKMLNCIIILYYNIIETQVFV